MDAHEKIIRLPEVVATVGLQKSAIYKKIKAGEFPAPIKLGKHASGWLESDVQQWILKQAGRLPANEAHGDQHPRAA